MAMALVETLADPVTARRGARPDDRCARRHVLQIMRTRSERNKTSQA